MVTNESGLNPCANIKCGCTTGVMAWDGCEMKSAAVIVTANAVNLIRMLISNSLHGTAAHARRILPERPSACIGCHVVDRFLDLDQVGWR